MTVAIVGFGADGESVELETFTCESHARQWLDSYIRFGDRGGYESFACHAIPFDGDWLWSVERD